MENLQDDVMEEPESGVTLSELKSSLKEVRSRKVLAKLNHKLNIKSRITQAKKTV
jgi:hypothetical protein